MKHVNWIFYIDLVWSASHGIALAST